MDAQEEVPQGGTAASDQGPTESQPLDPGKERASAAKADDWGDALDAFNDPEQAKEPAPQPTDRTPVKTQETPKEEDKGKSQVEQPPEATSLNLDKLAIPHKYKPMVEEHLKPIVSGFEAKLKETSDNFGVAKEGVVTLAAVLKDCAENPGKIPQYVEAYGEAIGIDPNLIERYRGISQRDGQQPPAEKKEVAPPKDLFGSVVEKYKGKLAAAQSEEEFTSILLSSLGETYEESEKSILSKMGPLIRGLLNEYHSKVVEPNLGTLKEVRQQAEHTVRSSAWDGAKAKLSEKYPDFSKYENTIKEKLLTDKKFNRLRTELNSGESDFTHEEVLEDIYQLVSMRDRMDAAKAPKPKVGGLAPTPKHIQTKKSGGSDWDEIRDEFWS